MERGSIMNRNLYEFGKFCYQLAGYTYAGIVLTVVLDMGSYGRRYLVFGVLLAFSFALMGILIIYMSNLNNRF